MSRILWLASYPKSGNTWMRAFLANYVLDNAGPVSIHDLRAFSLSDVRPRFYIEALEESADPRAMTAEQSIALRPAAQRRLAAAKEHAHFVKTHSRQGLLNGMPLIEPSVSAGAVYIVRNPLDIVPSYADHLGLGIDAILDMMTDPEHATVEADIRIMTALGRWDMHVDTWLGGKRAMPVCPVRYEDMTEKPEQTFARIVTILGMQPDRARLGRAIRHASFEELSRQESEGGFAERPPHMERFFRSGRSGEGRERLSAAQRERVFREFGTAMRKLGYHPEEA